MISLQILRDTLQAATAALQDAQKVLARVVRREATLTMLWEVTAKASAHLRDFDHAMVNLKEQHDAKQS